MEKIARLAQRECRYQFGQERELPFVSVMTSDDGSRFSGEYAFSFDVNGDGVGEVFFWEPDRRLSLGASVVSGGELSYVRQDCEALAAIPYGRVFVRDLNGDEAADLVVGGMNQYSGGAPQAFLNLPSGFVEVLHLAQNGAYTLIDVAVADLEGAAEETSDIAFGYDLVIDDGASVRLEWGAAVAQIDAVAPAPTHTLRRWNWASGASTEGAPTGEFALGHDATGTWLFVVTSPAAAAEPGDPFPGTVVRRQGGDFLELAIELESPPALVSGRPVDAWAMPFAGVGGALALLYGRYPSSIALYDLRDPTTRPLPVLHSFRTVEVHDFNREFGGGGPTIDRWMIDADGDGNVDFLEHGRRFTGLEPGPLDDLTLHRNLGGIGFGEPFTVEVSPFMNFLAESPFVAAGAASAAIVVNDYQALTESGPAGPPTFQVLECAPE